MTGLWHHLTAPLRLARRAGRWILAALAVLVLLAAMAGSFLTAWINADVVHWLTFAGNVFAGTFLVLTWRATRYGWRRIAGKWQRTCNLWEDNARHWREMYHKSVSYCASNHEERKPSVDKETSNGKSAMGKEPDWADRNPDTIMVVNELDTCGLEIEGKARNPRSGEIEEISRSAVGLQLKYYRMGDSVEERPEQEEVYYLSANAVLSLYAQLAGNINQFVKTLIRRGELDLGDVTVDIISQDGGKVDVILDQPR